MPDDLATRCRELYTLMGELPPRARPVAATTLGAWVGNRAGAVIAGAWDSWACIEQAG